MIYELPNEKLIENSKSTSEYSVINKYSSLK